MKLNLNGQSLDVNKLLLVYLFLKTKRQIQLLIKISNLLKRRF